MKLFEIINPEVGKLYKVDWDGPSLVKVTKVSGGKVGMQRVNGKGEPLKGVENFIEISSSEWSDTVDKQVKQTSPDQLLELAKKLIRELKSLPQGRYVRSGDGFDPEINPHKKTQVEVAIRYWGDWSNPEDAEDEEDYDWQVLSKKSQEVLDKTVKNFAKVNDVKVRWTTEEKNYINFSLEF